MRSATTSWGRVSTAYGCIPTRPSRGEDPIAETESTRPLSKWETTAAIMASSGRCCSLRGENARENLEWVAWHDQEWMR